MFQANEHSGPAIYSANPTPLSGASARPSKPDSGTDATPKTATPASLRRPFFSAFSVKTITYASAAVVIILFLSITATNLILAKTYYQSSEDNGLSQRLTDKAQVFENQLAFFQEIVNHVATQPTTQDILTNKDEISAQTWALQMRRFLPQAMGVALLTNDGRIMGEPADAQPGPQSLTDLARLSQGELAHTPPVHRLSEKTSHFDLVATVYDETDAQIGMVFVSFGLKTLESLLQNNTQHGQKLVLRDGNKNIISQHSLLRNNESQRSSTGKITNTHWQLSFTENNGQALPSFLNLTLFNVSALLLTIGIVTFLVRYALHSLGTDFTQIKTLLNNLAEGEPLSEEFATPQLRETAEILPAISHIQKDIEKKQQLLEHRQLNDELTGLSNRRQFNIEFARAYDFARRGTPVCVTLIHLRDIAQLESQQNKQIVKLLAKTLKEHTRKVDRIARLAPDQFAILMFGMSSEGTTPCLERMHKSFLSSQAQHPAIAETCIRSLAFGYTMIHPYRDNNAASVLKRTESALAIAQESGETCIISA